MNANTKASAVPGFMDSIIIILVAAALALFLLWATSRTQHIVAFELLPDWLKGSYNAVWTSAVSGATGIGLAIVRVFTRNAEDPRPNYLLLIMLITAILLTLIWLLPRVFSRDRGTSEESRLEGEVRDHLNHGYYSMALRETEELISINPSSAMAYKLKGNAHFALQEYTSALEAFQHSIDIDPTRHLGLFGKGAVLAVLGRYDEAKGIFEGLNRDSPSDMNVLYNLAGLELLLGNYSVAKTDYESIYNSQSELKASAAIGLGMSLMLPQTTAEPPVNDSPVVSKSMGYFRDAVCLKPELRGIFLDGSHQNVRENFDGYIRLLPKFQNISAFQAFLNHLRAGQSCWTEGTTRAREPLLRLSGTLLLAGLSMHVSWAQSLHFPLEPILPETIGHNLAFLTPSLKRATGESMELTRKDNRPTLQVVCCPSALVNGSGSSFPYPIYSKWFDEYRKSHSNVQINYQSVGSGAGIRQVSEGTVDFGASDAPMNDEQVKAFTDKHGFGILHFPTVLGAAVPTYNVPGVSAVLNFTPEALSEIFLGKVKKWNDPAIAGANKGINLPAGDIVVVHRSDGSGTTFIWTDYLSKVSDEWKNKVGKGSSVNWPVGLGGKGSEGVTGLIKQTPNSIGYIELIYAAQNNIPYGAVKNSYGKFIKADLASVSAAAAGAAKDMPADFRVSITNAPGPAAYPISSFTWLLIPQRIQDPSKREVIKDFLKWMLSDGQRYADDLSYSKLPREVVEKEKKTIDNVQ
jgi:phosphate transport system substrate-binding protein